MIDRQQISIPAEHAAQQSRKANFKGYMLAPMMGYTDRYFRYMLRLLHQDIILYTEMVTAEAIIHKDAAQQRRLLAFHSTENPNLVLQLGGNDPQKLATAARVAADLGYTAINLNVGCPSNKVKQGNFGACLMLQPLVVAECVARMQQAANLPISIKTRIGVDENDNYEFLIKFVTTVAAAGCNEFIIHARKAWLSGLSPKQNRTIPALNYERVYQLKQDFPQLAITINGGITSAAAAVQHIKQVDGVMLGRALYDNPLLVLDCYQEHDLLSKHAVRLQCIERMLEYVVAEAANGASLANMLRHMNGLFFAEPQAKTWRCLLTTVARQGKDSLRQNIPMLLQFAVHRA